MGQSRPKSVEGELEGFTKVDGVAIAARIARAMPPAQRERILAQMAHQAPAVAEAVQAKLVTMELEIASARISQNSQQTTVITRSSAPLAAPKATMPQPNEQRETVLAEREDLSPAELLLKSREGSVDDLEREIERQRSSAPGRRKIISA